MGGDGAWTSCDGRGFYVGGLGNQQTDSRFEADTYHGATPIPGQLTYDMASGNWHNDTIAQIADFTTPHGTHVRGRAMCARGFGEDPLVFVLGGHQTELDNTGKSTFNDITKVNLFNARDRTWLSQQTTAADNDFPPRRVRFCAAGAATSNGTYDIFVYGGQDEWANTLSDVWILSLPAFRWFKVDVESPKRYFHACTVVGNGQFLVSGGWEEENGWEEPDPWFRAMGILDMTSLEWTRGYNAAAGEYRSPQQVLDWYQHNGTDSVQWSSDAVRELFSPDENPPPKSDKPSASVIAGSVIGALAGAGVIGAAVWFLLRRRRMAAPGPSELYGDAHTFHHDGQDAKMPPYPDYSLPPSTELNYGHTTPQGLPSEYGRWELPTDVQRHGLHELPGGYEAQPPDRRRASICAS